MIIRQKYLDALTSFQDTDLVKVITGIRRCGKSTMLEMMRQKLVGDGVDPSRLFTFKMESMEFDGIEDYRELYHIVLDKIQGVEHPYLFFDELQNIEGWEKAINSLRVDYDCDIYITGSNAFLLSSEIATLISGRYVEIPMQTLTFSEYLDFRGASLPKGDLGSSGVVQLGDRSFATTKSLFADYMTYGGFPYLATKKPEKAVCSAYIRDLYQTIVVRDILAREKRRGHKTITDRKLLERICLYLSDNIGNRTSINKIVGTLKENGAASSNKTVDSYIEALLEAYLFTRADRFDIKGRALLATGGKYYICDTGLRNHLDGYRGSDTGRLLENIVHNQLVFDGYTVHVGHLRAGEIDFVASGNSGERFYIQVTETIFSQETHERELAPLRKIPDEFPKIVLTLDEVHPTDEDGMRIINIIDYLTGSAEL